MTLERASDSELKVICGEYSEVAKYPFSIYASGGKGGAGGDGGRGGSFSWLFSAFCLLLLPRKPIFFID